MDNRKIIKKVITLLQKLDEERRTDSFFTNPDLSCLIMVDQKYPRTIVISGPLKLEFLSEEIDVSPKRLIEAFKWIGGGQSPCAFKENAFTHETIISTDKSLWPKA